MATMDPYDRGDRLAQSSAVRPGVQAPAAAPLPAKVGVSSPARAAVLARPQAAAAPVTSAAPVAGVPSLAPAVAPPPSAAPRSAQVVEPFHVAQAKLFDSQAKAANAAGSPINDFARIDANDAARGDLFKQYHNGMAPGEFQASQRGAPAPAGQPNAAMADPFRASLARQVAQPGVQFAGSTPIYRGNAGDGGEGYSIADRNAGIAANATHQIGLYDMAQAEAGSKDPLRQAAAANAMADPKNRGGLKAAAILKGVDPRLVDSSMPYDGTQFDPSSYREQANGDPRLAGFATNLDDVSTPLHARLRLAAGSLTGEEGDLRKPLFDAWMTKNSVNPDFQRELQGYNPLNPSDPAAASKWTSGPIGRLLYQHLLGDPAGDAHRNQGVVSDLSKFGYAPTNIGLPTSGQ